MKSKHLLLSILLLTIMLITACTGGASNQEQPPTQAPELEPTATQVTPEKSPLMAPSPLDTPQAVAAQEVAAPEIKSPVIDPADIGADSGVVTGIIRAKHNDGDVRPLASALIGLAELVKSDDGDGYVGAAYSPSDSPRTLADENGVFILKDVAPGQYGLILDAVVTQALLTEPDDDSKDIIFEIKAGEQTDVGLLEYESLSYPGFVN